jgi:hypothetical protein
MDPLLDNSWQKPVGILHWITPGRPHSVAAAAAMDFFAAADDAGKARIPA